MLTAARDLDVVYVPIGMGSCILRDDHRARSARLPTEIVGVQAAGAPSYYESWREHRVVNTDSVNTKADGLATRMPDAQSLEIIRRGASRLVLVDDDAIAQAIPHLPHRHAQSRRGCGCGPRWRRRLPRKISCAERKSGSSRPVATSISSCSEAGCSAQAESGAGAHVARARAEWFMQ